MFQLRNLAVLQAWPSVKYGGAGRARTYDDRIMSPGL